MEQKRSQEDSSNRSAKFNYGRTTKISLFLIIMGIITFFLIFKIGTVKLYLRDFLQWVQEAGILGMLAFGGVYILTGMIFFPVLILTMAAGYIYSSIYGVIVGVSIATLIVYISATISALISMPMGRYVFRNFLREWVKKHYPSFLAVEQAINHYGFQLVVLWRLPPLFPFTIFNYFVGITSISFRDYALASLGMIPGCFVEVYLGSSISSVQEAMDGTLEEGNFGLGFIIGVLVCAVFGMAYVSILAKRRIDFILESSSIMNNPQFE